MEAYVYILASSFQKLYVGVTTKLEQRIWQHKNSTFPNAFTSRYQINKLVYFETFATIHTAIARERALKKWLRQQKLDLIITHNPTWRDLSEDWGKPIAPFNEANLRSPTTFENTISYLDNQTSHKQASDKQDAKKKL